MTRTEHPSAAKLVEPEAFRLETNGEKMGSVEIKQAKGLTP